MDPGTAAAGRQDAFPEAAAVYHTGKRIVIRLVVANGRIRKRPHRMSYKNIVERADAFFHEQMSRTPQHFQCEGCSLCCYGLFEIGAADIPLLAEGLAQLHPARRKRIVRRAAALMKD
ncbi:MAG TPA: hypothetical protein VKH35_00715, partial [Thermoanaerobaculia bacterium]|nr:hypothetical protein [Thermoanaerobaculia bacterium]